MVCVRERPLHSKITSYTPWCFMSGSISWTGTLLCQRWFDSTLLQARFLVYFSVRAFLSSAALHGRDTHLQRFDEARRPTTRIRACQAIFGWPSCPDAWMWMHGCGCMDVDAWMRMHGCGCMSFTLVEGGRNPVGFVRHHNHTVKDNSASSRNMTIRRISKPSV